MEEHSIPALYVSLATQDVEVSLADYLVIIAEAATAAAATGANSLDPYESGSLASKYLEGFQFGRTTATSCEWSIGLMPKARNGCYGRDGNAQRLSHTAQTLSRSAPLPAHTMSADHPD